MKKIIGIIVLAALCSFRTWTGAFDFNIAMPDGSQQNLSNYSGKKLMIVVLPSTHTDSDSSLLQTLASLNKVYKDSITMIGIPSYEDGFADDSMYSLMTWYRSYLDSNFIIAGGMNTRKTSPYQAPLFSYLTNADQNGYFDKDVYGVGEEFFINEGGNLYGISTPGAELDEEVFNQMIHKQSAQ
jgi:glutathione peroxidase-family protein